MNEVWAFACPGNFVATNLAGPEPVATLSPISITVIVENDTIKLPVHVPDGKLAEIFLPGEPGPRGSAENMETVRVFIGRLDKDADDLAVVR